MTESKESPSADALLREAVEVLTEVTRHFTRTPSTYRDSVMRGVAHTTLSRIKQYLKEQEDSRG